MAQGLQPLWGRCYGKLDTEEMNWYFRRDAELVQTASAVLPLFCLSFIPMSLNLIYTAFLFSAKRTGAADAIAVSRGVVVKSLAIFGIPVLFGSDMIWTAPFAAETVTLLFAFGLSKAGR